MHTLLAMRRFTRILTGIGECRPRMLQVTARLYVSAGQLAVVAGKVDDMVAGCPRVRRGPYRWLCTGYAATVSPSR